MKLNRGRAAGRENGRVEGDGVAGSGVCERDRLAQAGLAVAGDQLVVGGVDDEAGHVGWLERSW